MDRRNTAETHDVVVVGARCAGAATAMLLARQGLDVAVIDRAEFPSDTLSTHGIARGGVVQLARWGLLDEVVASGAPPIRQHSFHRAGCEIVKPVKNRAGVDHLLAPRRDVLDHILLRAAEADGATVRTGLSVAATLRNPDGRVAGVSVRDRHGARHQLRARFVVGADGIRSAVARSVGARTLETWPPSGWTAYAYVAGLDTAGFEFHLGDRSFAGVFPTHGGQANVWVMGPGPMPALGPADQRPQVFAALLDCTSPALGARVGRAVVTAPVRAVTGLPNYIREAAGPGWALVGDAAYHRDPISGHGITDAFRDAELLARHLGPALHGEAAEHEALAAYAVERHQALARIFDVTLQMAKYPPADEFVALQKRLARFIGAEAAWLAGLPQITRDRRGIAA